MITFLFAHMAPEAETPGNSIPSFLLHHNTEARYSLFVLPPPLLRCSCPSALQAIVCQELLDEVHVRHQHAPAAVAL